MQGILVISFFASFSAPLRYLLVFIASLLMTQFVNWAIYHWAFDSRPFGPWAKSEKKGVRRTWVDRLPIVGWWRLRKELERHGQWFWLRPFLLEVIVPVCMLWLYHYELSGNTLSVSRVARVMHVELHGGYLAHFILIALMLVATFIDYDEKTIPDLITVPGTCLGLIGAATVPGWLPYTWVPSLARHDELQLCSPESWVNWLDGTWGLGIALAIICLWCFAISDRRWITRRGFLKAIQYFLAVMFRSHWWKVVMTVGVLMALGVWFAWSRQQVLGRWPQLLSSLMGLAGAAGITWGVRISARWGLQVEALGFGDVTLMAMIGTFVGWQPGLLIFFFAPMVSILIVVIQWLLTGQNATPYGPYLCAATLWVLVDWVRMWEWAKGLFGLGWILLMVMVICVMVMGIMLWIWRLIRGRPRVEL